MAEKINWYYDSVLNSRGNQVIVGVRKSDGTQTQVGDIITHYDAKNKTPEQLKNLADRISELIPRESTIYQSKDEYLFKLRNEGRCPVQLVEIIKSNQEILDEFEVSSQDAINITYDSSKIYDETFVASMTELSLGINNQWIEGNGADSMASGAVDAAATVMQGGAIASMTNTLDSMGYGNSPLIKRLKSLNQMHYRSSTQFMKAYKGTNVSIPVAITRSFVYDQYGRSHDKDIKNIVKWALGEEIDLGEFTNTDDLINNANSSQSTGVMGNVAGSVMSYVKSVGGIQQKGPNGYVYNAAHWKKMRNPDGGLLPGTCYIKLPNGIVIPDLLISDMTVSFSNTQVLTMNGLRPLTVTINIQFLPARTWGRLDALAVMDYSKGIDITKTYGIT